MKGRGLTLYTWLLIAFLFVPAAIAVPASFSASSELRFPPRGFSLAWYRAFFDDPAWMGATWVSLRVAIGATAIALVVGAPAALALVRHRNVGTKLVWAVLMIPLVVPAVIAATGLFVIAIHLSLLGSLWVAMVGHAVLALPIVVIVISAGLSAFDETLADAASSLGASRGLILRRVILPAVLPSVVVAAIFAFIISWDEVVLSSFLLASAGDVTLPVRIFSYLSDAVNPIPAAISSLLLAVTAFALGVVLVIQRSLEVGAGRTKRDADRPSTS